MPCCSKYFPQSWCSFTRVWVQEVINAIEKHISKIRVRIEEC